MSWSYSNIDATPHAREIIRATTTLQCSAVDFVPVTQIHDMVDLTMTQWARALTEILDKQIAIVASDENHQECLILAVAPHYAPSGTDNSSSHS